MNATGDTGFTGGLDAVLGEVGVSFCVPPSAILLLFVGSLGSRVCWLLAAAPSRS